MEQTCLSCQGRKANLKCGICQNAICKPCTQFLPAGSFSFQSKLSEDLKHITYCGFCFDQKVAPALTAYNQMMDQAKNVFVFFKTQGKETRLIKRSKAPLKVTNCADKDETLLRLAFLAAQEDYNALIDVDLVGEKVRDNFYQTHKWSCSGVPAMVDGDRLNTHIQHRDALPPRRGR